MKKEREYVLIEVENGQKKRVTIPSDVSSDKVQLFKEYAQANWNWEHLVTRKFKTSLGRTYSLPIINIKTVLKILPKDEANELKILDREARTALGVLNSRRISVWGRETPNLKVKRALFDEYSTKMLEMLGKGWSAQEVHKQLLLEGVDIPYRQISDFHMKNREEVSRLRNEWNKDTDDIPLTSKRSRLEKLSYLYHEVSSDFEKVSSPVLKTTLSKELRGIIEQAKKEVEGEELKLTVSGNIDVNATLNVAMTSTKMLQGLTINQIIISRVAARLKLPSQYLIDRLAHSYYAKYNGYRTNEDLKTKPIYPTSVQYDILSDEIQGKNEQWEREQKQYEDAVIIEEVKEPSTFDKEEIKKRLRKKLGIQ